MRRSSFVPRALALLLACTASSGCWIAARVHANAQAEKIRTNGAAITANLQQTRRFATEDGVPVCPETSPPPCASPVVTLAKQDDVIAMGVVDARGFYRVNLPVQIGLVEAARTSAEPSWAAYQAGVVEIEKAVPESKRVPPGDIVLENLLQQPQAFAPYRIVTHTDFTGVEDLQAQGDEVSFRSVIASKQGGYAQMIVRFANRELAQAFRERSMSFQCNGAICDKLSLVASVSQRPQQLIDGSGRTYLAPVLIVETWVDRYGLRRADS